SVNERKPMKKNTTIMMFLFAALALFTVQANAAKQINDMSDINLTVFVPCAAGGAGEIVDLSGPLHTLITFTINGNNVSGKAHFQPQGIVGSGETIGAIPSDQLLVHKTPLVIEQPFLSPQAAAVAAERTIRSNDAMTRDNDTDHVLAIGPPDRATHLNIAKFLRHPRIRSRFAGWN